MSKDMLLVSSKRNSQKSIQQYNEFNKANEIQNSKTFNPH